jgi:hypothetical protein
MNHKQHWRHSLDNPVNISGQLLEDMVENYCVSNKISYKRARPGAHEIDFIIESNKGKIFADCTNQNSGGSVEEKLPHKLWKYFKKYQYRNVYIVKGDHKISPKVLEHCNEMARGYNFELHFVNYEQFTNKLVAKEDGFFG